MLEVSRGGYYDWKERQPGPRQQRRQELDRQIRAVFQSHRGVYGSPRVYRQLQAQGVACCRNTIAKRMNQMDLQAMQRKRFVLQTTDSHHDWPVAGNVLNQQFEVDQINQVWTADITYIPTDEGWWTTASSTET